MNIRTATTDDKSAIIELINAAYKVAEFFKLEDRLNEKEFEHYFSTGNFTVLENKGELVGCIYYRLKANILNFSLLSVAQDYQGKGYSKILVKRTEEIALENNCDTISIEVVNLREPLFPFYLHLGFESVGISPFPKSTRLPCHLVNMVKHLK